MRSAKLRARYFRLSAAFAVVWLALVVPAEAFHFFRGEEDGMADSGCTPATGNIGDLPTNVGAVVDVFHQSYDNSFPHLPTEPHEVRIHVGEQVQWRWTSSHCHSVTSSVAGIFDSGFVYPTNPPANQPVKVVPGFLDYPLPDDAPSLTYTKTFTEPGAYPYFCIHHAIIGMEGTVIVEP